MMEIKIGAPQLATWNTAGLFAEDHRRDGQFKKEKVATPLAQKAICVRSSTKRKRN
jgi:hypothetical protein